ncbi:unnamed protein product [Clonostachys rosea]|uniref:Carrier domain-containing protein n=1 Tax=Bionectria ochroleuca TaxID=29856 RepID=A0ABY6UMZ7_BIOOC|nr:unnamed protein product [Clonostachys rosea]
MPQNPSQEAVVGRRLLPTVVDQLASSDPDRIIYSVAKSRSPSDGFQDISARTLARAVDRCAWHIEATLGPGQDFPTLAYMGPQDAFYAILILACIKTGYKPFLTSPRNSLDAHLYLFEETKCSTLLIPPGFTLPVLKGLMDKSQISITEIQGMQHWLEDRENEADRPYQYNKTFSQAVSDPIAVLHTSGSTGMPKPILQTHGLHAPLDAYTALPSLGHQPTFSAMCAGARVYLGVPLFHAAGLSLFLAACIYSNYTMVLGPFPPSGEIANAVHVHGNVQQSILPPFTLMELVKNPDHFENLGRLQQITFGGGLLPKEIGDRVITKTRLLNCLGSTECGTLPAQLCDPKDWAYLSLSPVVGHRYEQVSEDLYEQVIVRDPKLERYQGVFNIFPELNEWHMRDLYSKHPTKENLWLYRGRIDDVIVFSNGEKLNPVDMEAIICGNPVVDGAIIAGFGQFQSSLLVEATKPPTNEAEKEDLLEAIWPSVEAANKQCPSHGRVHRHMIIFTLPDKPMSRASKGTVQRKATIHLYETELDALYKNTNKPVTNLPNGIGSHDVTSVMKHIIATSTDIPIDGLNPDDDLFELGLDSLQVTLIAREINSWLKERASASKVEPRNIYLNPSLASLTAVVSSLSNGQPHKETDESREEKMQKLYESHASQILISARQPETQSTERLVVLLTGATGSLGAYILDALVRDPRVIQIYTLNRGPKSIERLQVSLAAKKLQSLSDKVTCLDADLSRPYFTLSRSEYKNLLTNVTTVIHNAWQVDFNLSVASFSSQISGVKRLIDFSTHSRLGAKIVFISSISSIASRQQLSGQTGRVPEVIYDDWRSPQPFGYAESKFIAERLLDTASKEANVPTIVCRVGQVAGPTGEAGVWPKHEWLPSLIASSKYLGKLPTSLGQHDTVDWVPVDGVAQTIVDIAASSSKVELPGSTVYHIANPKYTTWPELLPIINQHLGQEKALETVALSEWVGALRDTQNQTDNVAQNPAVRLLHFFDDLLGHGEESLLLDTQNSIRSSPTLANLEPVHDSWMENWLRQWAF